MRTKCLGEKCDSIVQELGDANKQLEAMKEKYNEVKTNLLHWTAELDGYKNRAN